MNSLTVSFFNFFILIGILFYQLKGPIRHFVATRHETLRDELKAVREQLRLSQEKYDEFSAKLRGLDSEVAIMRELAQQEVALMTQRVVADGRRLAAHIVSDAKSAADGLFTDLKKEYYAGLSTQVLARAEGILKARLTQDDQARIQREFSQAVESIQ